MDSPGHKLSRNTNKRKSALKRRQKQSTLYSKPLTEIGENPSKHSPAGKPVSEWSLARRLIDGPDSPDVAPEEVPAARTPPLGSFPELLARTADAGFDARSAIRASVPIPVLVGRTHANKVTASRALRSGRWLRRALRASRFLPCRQALSDISVGVLRTPPRRRAPGPQQYCEVASIRTWASVLCSRRSSLGVRLMSSHFRRWGLPSLVSARLGHSRSSRSLCP